MSKPFQKIYGREKKPQYLGTLHTEGEGPSIPGSLKSHSISIPTEEIYRQCRIFGRRVYTIVDAFFLLSRYRAQLQSLNMVNKMTAPKSLPPNSRLAIRKAKK